MDEANRTAIAGDPVAVIALPVGRGARLELGPRSSWFRSVRRFVRTTMLGARLENVILALIIVLIPGNARVVRGATLSVKQDLYIEAARSVGARDARILIQHILPNVAAPIIILASVQLGTAILVEASLS